MGKGFVFVVLGILMLSLVSAHSVYSGDEYSYKEKIVDSKYFPDEHRAYTRTTYIDYENDDRYSTSEYRHGYSYRATVEYRDRHYPDEDFYEKYDRRYEPRERESRNYYQGYESYSKYKNYDRGYRDYRDGHEDYRKGYSGHKDYGWNSKDYYYKYAPHLREYQKKECYHEAPRGKLFYIQCPQ